MPQANPLPTRPEAEAFPTRRVLRQGGLECEPGVDLEVEALQKLQEDQNHGVSQEKSRAVRVLEDREAGACRRTEGHIREAHLRQEEGQELEVGRRTPGQSAGVCQRGDRGVEAEVDQNIQGFPKAEVQGEARQDILDPSAVVHPGRLERGLRRYQDEEDLLVF